MAARIRTSLKRVRRREWIILLLPASILLIVIFKPPQQEIKVSKLDTVTIPVASYDVDEGTAFQDIIWIKVDYPKDLISSDMIFDQQLLQGKVSKRYISAKSPIRVNDFTDLNITNLLAAKIPNGMRAVTVKVDATTAVEGWASSGSLVDVLLVEKDRTLLVAEKVLVISAERSLHSKTDADSPSIPSTVSLLVDQEQCMAISTAVSRGKIAFALRNKGDESNWKRKEFTSDRLAQGSGAGKIQGYVEVGNAKFYSLVGDTWVASRSGAGMIRNEVFQDNTHAKEQ